MIRRIMTILYRDFLRSVRDSILLYIVLSPLILALALRFLLPGMMQPTAVEIVTSPQAFELIHADIDENLGDVHTFTVLENDLLVRSAVLEPGNVAGLVIDSGGVELISRRTSLCFC